MPQLAAKKGGQPIPCFFQEPRYGDGDKAFLRSLGHSVVETPAAQAMVDDTTLVLGIHLYRNLYQELMATTLPAVLIGTDWRVIDSFEQCVGNFLFPSFSSFLRFRVRPADTHRLSRVFPPSDGLARDFRLADMFKASEVVEFPIDAAEPFGDTAIYFRKRGGESAAAGSEDREAETAA